MKQYVLIVVFALAVIGLYHLIDIRLFNLDLTRNTKDALFKLRNEPDVNRSLTLFNIGKLEPAELGLKIDSLLAAEPKAIGVNLCHYDRNPQQLIQKYKSDKRVVFANCNSSGTGILSQIIDDGNIVTHFKSDKPDYFEFQLAKFNGRGNDLERINYRARCCLGTAELSDPVSSIEGRYLKDKILLIGYMGDYLTEEVYYFKNCRVTPLNADYGDDGALPDKYDIEISADIISTMGSRNFINEINQVSRVLIILAFSLVNVMALALVRKKSTIVNLITATVLFVLLTGLGSFLLVYLFNEGYLLELDELPLVLLVTTVFTVLLNIRQKKAGVQQK